MSEDNPDNPIDEPPVNPPHESDEDPDIDIEQEVFLQCSVKGSVSVRGSASILPLHELSRDSGTVAFFQEINQARTDPVEGFGLVRLDEGFVSVVGESSEIDYGGCEVVCTANSIDGTFEFAEELDKYALVEVDIVNPGFKETGLPHWVVEDTFEWINSGMPSHLSQVYHSNIANLGIALERSNPGHLEEYAPPYQARFNSACNKDWYDWFNSTVDFDIANSIGDAGVSLPYANAVLYVESLGQVLVGGHGNLISIDVLTYAVSRVIVDPRRTLFIKDLYHFDGKVYILDESNLYIWDLSTDSITKDNGLGLSEGLAKIVVMFSQNLVIGSSDGIYARKLSQDSWQQVVSASSPVDAIIAPDSAIAVINNEFWYSSEGFSWTKVGTVSDKNISQIAKHRSQILVASDEGAYGDSGSLYSNRISLSLLDILNDLEESAVAVVNAVVSNFSSAAFGLSNGQYITWADSFVLYEDSNLPTIHKAIYVEDSLWLFGYDLFKIEGETRIRKLATGDPVGKAQKFTLES